VIRITFPEGDSSRAAWQEFWRRILYLRQQSIKINCCECDSIVSARTISCGST
jgi:hypothetical protein